MKRFQELHTNEIFKVLFYEIKPLNGDKLLKQKYSLMMYQINNKQSVIFIKTGEDTCAEMSTGTEFHLENNKMINEDTGLFFFGTFVDTSSMGPVVDSQLLRNYFDDAIKSNEPKDQMTLARKGTF